MRRDLSAVALLTALAISTASLTVFATPASAASRNVGTETAYRAALDELSENPSGPHTITLTADIDLTAGGDPSYTGTQALTIDGAGHTIDAGGTSRILARFAGTSTVTLTGLVLTGGSAPGGLGGAVHSANGILYVVASTLTGNTAIDGGAISGGGGVAYVINSTVTGNTAANAGGGVFAGGVGLFGSTVASNRALQGANVASTGNFGGFGSVVADPLGAANCLAARTVSGGYNYATDGSCGYTGTGDIPDGADPLLGPVRDNGGPTPTMFPLWASPLRDAIPNASCSGSLPADQRGITRPYPTGGDCDIGAVEAVYPPHAFTDVAAWVDSSVRWITSTVNDPPLMTGITPTAFRPNDNITRAQFARLLYREAGAPDVSALPPHGFTDVPAWVTDAVCWAKANNVMTGITPTLFKPNDPITRGQVARAKYRFAGQQDTSGFAPHPFTDVPAWVDQAVTWAAHHTLMTGITATTFRPDDPITRGQVARLDERLGLNPDAWADPSTAPRTLPFRPDTG